MLQGKIKLSGMPRTVTLPRGIVAEPGPVLNVLPREPNPPLDRAGQKGQAREGRKKRRKGKRKEGVGRKKKKRKNPKVAVGNQKSELRHFGSRGWNV